ncbi:MAG: DNA polymerase III subunit gamma and tau [Rhodoglobus sp.]
MVAALYRRYRPETFAELIGQSQVTDPLRTALRTDRVNHAYLFSGPRGCGKTTSARILARCLNCVEGPTDTPCGVCPSCVELARDGSGSLDVVEIDAASHNGVDDARDLRERAVFAPARDRFKIFILDEAHMVTPQGFNALLKIVEEPPEHVKFIFATTEPEKVIGTIRSRTHHYPFRLVPPAQMLDYVQQLCESEKVHVEAGVLPLVVRTGGGSVRDTLSLLDQLIAGSESDSVGYERAVALLGYTHGALLDEAVDAIGSRDAAAAFGAVDRVIQTGQDPRRFVEDLLERLRDLIIVAATSGNAASVLRGVPQDQLDRMAAQSAAFGQAELSRAADAVNSALTEMTGATSPRLHLELMVARILVPASDDTQRGALARVERLERRVGVEGAGGAVSAPGPAAQAPAPQKPAAQKPAVQAPSVEKPAAAPPAPAAATPPVATPAAQAVPEIRSIDPVISVPVGPVTLAQVKDAWTEILEVVKDARLNAWMVVFTAKPLELRDNNVLVLSFASQRDVDALKQQAAPGQGVGELLKKAFVQVLGFEPAFIARVDASAAQQHAAPPALSTEEPPADDFPPTEGGGWAVASIPDSEPMPERAEVSGLGEKKPSTAPQKSARPETRADAPKTPAAPPVTQAAPQAAPPATQAAPPASAAKTTAAPSTNARYGEAVVRQLLGATFIEEQAVAPRVVPMPRDD